MALYRDEGIVLRTHKLGESDRIVVLLTAGRGKVRAVAKGVRRASSRLGGRLEPGGHLALLLHEGRELHVVTQAEAIEPFGELRADLVRLRDALALLEAVDQVAREGEADPRLYAMLLRALRTLVAHPAPLLVAGFYWKLLALEGVAPGVTECARCGASAAEVDLVAFDPSEGASCRGCAPGGGGRRAVTPEALGVVAAILGGDLAGALSTPPGPLATEVTDLATRALEGHLERRLRVPRLLERSVARLAVP
ncbi:MAG: DNA repair protein RecO [Actinomycetota bacterium]|nr:DNA repair protein RecO [Actinomycetota bacterium]